jgi:hypothetical protein
MRHLPTLLLALLAATLQQRAWTPPAANADREAMCQLMNAAKEAAGLDLYNHFAYCCLFNQAYGSALDYHQDHPSGCLRHAITVFIYDSRLFSVNVQADHPRKLAAVRREVAPGAVGSAWGPALDKVWEFIP